MPNSNKSRERTINGVKFIEGSDNVFLDLGFEEVEAVNLMLRSKLMMRIEQIIQEQGLTQVEAAKILGVGQPRVSDLFNGKLERFTVDMLLRWLAKLGKRVTIQVDGKEVA